MTELSNPLSRRQASNSLVGTAAMALGLQSPKGMSRVADLDQMPAFTIAATKGIPEKATIRTENTTRARLDSLMQMPDHKMGTTKFDRL